MSRQHPFHTKIKVSHHVDLVDHLRHNRRQHQSHLRQRIASLLLVVLLSLVVMFTSYRIIHAMDAVPNTNELVIDEISRANPGVVDSVSIRERIHDNIPGWEGEMQRGERPIKGQETMLRPGFGTEDQGDPMGRKHSEFDERQYLIEGSREGIISRKENANKEVIHHHRYSHVFHKRHHKPFVTLPKIPNYYQPRTERDKQRYWRLRVSERGNRIDCQISYNRASSSSSSLIERNMSPFKGSYNNEKYVIHIHGLHHTGTGYLRQTMQHALDKSFAKSDDSPAASIHDGLAPHRHGVTSSKYIVPEDEGQHFQNVYPSFRYRREYFNGAHADPSKLGQLAYMADYCTIGNTRNGDSNSGDSQDSYAREIGSILLKEWGLFWNTSATFLIQKTPSLDVKFLESVKVLPTLHVIIVRHPMTSNSWSTPWMGYMWLDAFAHTLGILARDEIEWYAVVTYEALIHYHDIVVDELMEVVRSGIERFRSIKTVRRVSVSQNLMHRRLHLHSPLGDEETSNYPALSYLVPKSASIDLWKKCLGIKMCNSLLDELTTDVLPHFGYVSMDWTDITPDDSKAERDDEEEASIIDEVAFGGSDDEISEGTTPSDPDEDSLMPVLSKSPGLVTVSENFGHVLFSSEGDALLKYRNIDSGTNEQMGDKPSVELVSTMKGMLAVYRKKLSSGRVRGSNQRKRRVWRRRYSTRSN